MYEPPRATSGTVIPTSSVWCVPPMVPGYGNFTNEVLAEHAQLLYWPVRAKDDNISKLFCTKANEVEAMQTAETIPGTRTADGPNTIVTDRITITSPMIAMVYSTVRRADGCGPTITKTIRTMLAGHLSSIRRNDVGAAPRYPFDYSDLNWMCESSDGTFTVQDGQGPDCYQNVPVAAYWQGPKMYMQYCNRPGVLNSTEVQDWTILNDYEPYIIEEETFTSELHELYRNNARWLQFGIWDPPIALIQQTAAAEPTLPHMLAATPATTTRTYVPEATPAIPAQPAVTELQKTEAPLPNSHLAVPTSTADVHVGPHVGMAAQRQSSSVDQPAQAAPSSQSAQANDIVPAPTQNTGSAFVNAFANDATAFIVGSQTLVVGGNAQTVGGQVASAAVPSAIIVGEGLAQSTMQLQSQQEQKQAPPNRVMAIGSVTLTQQPSGSGAPGQILQNAYLTITVTLPKGQVGPAPVTIGSWTLTPTIGAGGHYILQNAETALTVQQMTPAIPPHDSPGPAGLPSTTPEPAVELHDANAILTINSIALTASPAADYEVLYDAQTTVTTSHGAAITMGPHVISVVNSNGLARLAVSSLSEQKQNANSTKIAKGKSSTATSSLVSAETSNAPASIETSGAFRRSPGGLASSIGILCLSFASFLL
ncbi:hypothetical protein Slin15195_G088660 [Septoria linicola]|uniref:Uncharacterized protein n=1 Tax=Septoria linicola TaxID=215465 RepID=A0A9Q9EMH8_9PEZI|nr:hypothetical protein Slin14017_G091310 [Septoria linicola]USW55547.1 hypothetical protein Slin15195_G088660 [Septoria linicola]